jgi:LAO/AO transport system kinase
LPGAGIPVLEGLVSGGKRVLSAALAAAESRPDDPGLVALLDAAHGAPRAHVIGLTGPPGVGKSTLVDGLVARWRAAGRTVGVIAVDPSSRVSGGALLGDRTRIVTDPDDQGVFVRSMAARDRLGGLAALSVAAVVLMRAVYDVVLVETVGVGQSEADIAMVADTVVFCVQPASGDSLQFMKAGIVEIPHIAVVTKADLGAPARRAAADLAGAIDLAAAAGDAWPVAILTVSAMRGEGMDSLVEAIEGHGRWLGGAGRLAAARHTQARHWLRDAVRIRFGSDGLERAGAALDLASGEGPFSRLARIGSQIVASRVRK